MVLKFGTRISVIFDFFLLFRDIHEVEIALDRANKANSEAQKAVRRYQDQEVAKNAIKHYQDQMREANCAYENDQRQRQEVAESASLAERRANALAGTLC